MSPRDLNKVELTVVLSSWFVAFLGVGHLVYRAIEPILLQ